MKLTRGVPQHSPYHMARATSGQQAVILPLSTDAGAYCASADCEAQLDML